MNQWPFIQPLMNWDFCEALCGAAHFESFDKSTQSRYSACAPRLFLLPFQPWSSALQRSALRLNSACLLCDGKAIFLYRKQAVWRFFFFLWGGALHPDTPKSSFLTALILPVPHPSTVLLIVLSTEIHTHPGLMHFIKEATFGGWNTLEYITVW